MPCTAWFIWLSPGTAPRPLPGPAATPGTAAAVTAGEEEVAEVPCSREAAGAPPDPGAAIVASAVYHTNKATKHAVAVPFGFCAARRRLLSAAPCSNRRGEPRPTPREQAQIAALRLTVVIKPNKRDKIEEETKGGRHSDGHSRLLCAVDCGQGA